jgi:hypothetical protein
MSPLDFMRRLAALVPRLLLRQPRTASRVNPGSSMADLGRTFTTAALDSPP